MIQEAHSFAISNDIEISDENICCAGDEHNHQDKKKIVGPVIKTIVKLICCLKALDLPKKVW